MVLGKTWGGGGQGKGGGWGGSICDEGTRLTFLKFCWKVVENFEWKCHRCTKTNFNCKSTGGSQSVRHLNLYVDRFVLLICLWWLYWWQSHVYSKIGNLPIQVVWICELVALPSSYLFNWGGGGFNFKFWLVRTDEVIKTLIVVHDCIFAIKYFGSRFFKSLTYNCALMGVLYSPKPSKAANSLSVVR